MEILNGILQIISNYVHVYNMMNKNEVVFMKSDEFLNEVLSSDICPNNFEKIYKEFRQYQKLAINTLNEFHRICEKNKITYQLAYGSLLGAIRDGEQVPWDYDVDVIVPYEEKDKLIDALKKDLSSQYYFYCPEVDTRCQFFYPRITPKGYRSDILHVDVFYVVGTPENAIAREKFINEIEKLSRVRFGKKVQIIRESKGNIKRGIKLFLKKLLAVLSFRNDELKQCYKICSKYNATKSTVGCLLSPIAKNNSFFGKDIWDTDLITLDIGTFRVSKQYQMLLYNCYKDYQSIPPLKKRLDEVLIHHKWLTKYSKK